MAEIAFFVDAATEDNGMLPIFEHLNSAFHGVEQISYSDLSSCSPRLVITNQATFLSDLTDKYPVIFFLTEPTGYPLLKTGLPARRIFLNPLRRLESIFVFSNFAAKEFEETYRIKPIVQLPPIKQISRSHGGNVILYSQMPPQIKRSLDKWEFAPYERPSDFRKASVYVDMTSTYECVNNRLCLAASYGVPCIASYKGSNPELASSGDILLPPTSPENNWIGAIKIALRDRRTKSEENKKSSTRFQNMSNIDKQIERIERVTKRKLGTSQLPKIAAMLQEKKALEKIEALNQRRKSRSSNSQTKKGKSVMGRRETLAERERRAQRNAKRLAAQIQASDIPTYEIVETPSWFTNTDTCDVSIIVPMYKSKAHIERQIREWDLSDDGLSKEIIYVDDLCPQQSHEVVLPTWEMHRQYLKGKPIGKLIRSKVNRGYGPNCNLGAKHASGKYLIFLNADIYVLHNWVRPMFDLCKNDPKIGIVGNMHLQSRTGGNYIDSAGSEWHWVGGHFEHIGRTSYQLRRLDGAMELHNLPEDLKIPAEREMVTGACFMMPRKVFDEIGGYDEIYKIGYWEDSDMNMAVREKGYKIYYQPESKVLHAGGHSRANNHQFKRQNRQRFFFRWVDTGFLDKVVQQKRPPDRREPNITNLKDAFKGEAVGCIIACNEEEFLEASVRSVSSLCNRFVFVIGGNDYARRVGMCDDKGYPKDNTLEIARSLAKEFNGVVIEPPGRCWCGKTEMRNAYTKHLRPNNWMFMLDGDEVYKPGQLWVIANLMQSYECLRLQYYVFWNNVDTLGVGEWEKYPQERIVKWKQGYHYEGRNHLGLVDGENKEVAFRVPTFRSNEKLFYHYSWVRPLWKIRQKLDYYALQLSEEWGNRDPVNPNYVDEVFLRWRTNPEEMQYTHPRGGGRVCPFAGIHPYEVTQLIQQGKLNF